LSEKGQSLPKLVELLGAAVFSKNYICIDGEFSNGKRPTAQLGEQNMKDVKSQDLELNFNLKWRNIRFEMLIRQRRGSSQKEK
jgi:hypothetical protein